MKTTTTLTALALMTMALMTLPAAQASALHAVDLKTDNQIAVYNLNGFHYCDYIGGSLPYDCVGVDGTCYYEWRDDDSNADPHDANATIYREICVDSMFHVGSPVQVR